MIDILLYCFSAAVLLLIFTQGMKHPPDNDPMDWH